MFKLGFELTRTFFLNSFGAPCLPPTLILANPGACWAKRENNHMFKEWILWHGGELERYNYLYLPYLFLNHCQCYILHWRSLRKSSKWRSCSMVSLYYSCFIWNKFFIFHSHEYLPIMAHRNTNLESLDRTLLPYQL